MNSNRLKYASTPFFGTRKHPLVSISEEMESEPDPMTYALPEFQPVMTPQPINPSMTDYPPLPQQPYFSQAPIMPQPMPNYFPPQQPPFYGQTQPFGMQTQPLAPIQPPPVAAKPSRAPFTTNPFEDGFSSTQANDVVPSPPSMPMQQTMPTQTAPYITPAPSPYVMPAPYQQPAMPMASYSPTMMGHTGGYQPVPMYSQEYPAQAPMQPQPAPHAPPPRKKASFSFTLGTLMGIFLFAILPILFVSAFFLPSSYAVIRYLFIAISIICVTVMWLRRTFTASTRLTTSVLYVILFTVCVIFLLQDTLDAKQTSSDPAIAAVQESVQPTVTIEPTADPYADPTPQPIGTSLAELALTNFMNLWMGMNTPDMVAYVQPSWCSSLENPSASLFTLLANRTPEDFEIESISGSDNDSSRTVTMTATINKNNGSSSVKYRFMILMVKEGGEWYVDPNSLATNDSIEDDDVVVNAEQIDTGFATEAPRMTATPVPAGTTTLYYNENGGSYYHLDQNCSSVNDEYLPLTGTFLYSDLTSYSSSLSPCLACSAPVDPLEEDVVAEE